MRRPNAGKADYNKEVERLREQNEVNHNRWVLHVNQSLNSFQDQMQKMRKDLEDRMDMQDSRYVLLSSQVHEISNKLSSIEHDLKQAIGILDKGLTVHEEYACDKIKEFEKKFVSIEMLEETISTLKDLFDKMSHMFEAYRDYSDSRLEKGLNKMEEYVDSCVLEILSKPSEIPNLIKSFEKRFGELQVDVAGSKEAADKCVKKVFINHKYFEHLDDRLKKLEDK